MDRNQQRGWGAGTGGCEFGRKGMEVGEGMKEEDKEPKGLFVPVSYFFVDENGQNKKLIFFFFFFFS